jgi:hypothetical protein
MDPALDKIIGENIPPNELKSRGIRLMLGTSQAELLMANLFGDKFDVCQILALDRIRNTRIQRVIHSLRICYQQDSDHKGRPLFSRRLFFSEQRSPMRPPQF